MVIFETSSSFKYKTDINANCILKYLGRSFAIVPRSWQPRGYVDVDYDDFTPENHWLGKIIEQTDIKSQKQ